MSQPSCILVVNVDSDPDPVTEYQEDAAILAKYDRMMAINAEEAQGKGAITVLTGPIYRERFLRAPFTEFWRKWKDMGGAIVLHPEEDLYGPPEGMTGDPTAYYDADHMASVIRHCVDVFAQSGLTFDAYRGGYHGFTTAIGRALIDCGLTTDLSCAPEVVWPEKAAQWQGMPTSAFYMDVSGGAPVARETPNESTLFEVPWAWDGLAVGKARRFVVGENYMINEFSTEDAICRVWDAVQARSVQESRPQIVSMVCHTYTMGKPEYEQRLRAVLRHVAASGGTFMTPMEAKAFFDAREQASAHQEA